MIEKNHKIILTLILLVGVLLLFVNLEKYDLWGDEALTFPKGESFSQVLKYQQITGGLVHPPLYSLVQFYWVELVGYGTAANRLIWAFFGFLNLWLVYLVGKELFNRRTGLVATLLCATSPFLVQYSRMIRYYPLTTLAVLLVIWSFARLRRTGRWSDWIFFTLSGAMLIYQDYLGFFVLVFLYLYLLIDFRKARQNLKQWVLAPVVIFILFLPWLPTIFGQVSTNASPYPEHEPKAIKEAPRIAQKAMGIRGVAFNSVLKSGFLFYTFTLGETTYFWRWMITLPIMAAFGFLLLRSLKRIRGPDGDNKSLLLFTLFGVGLFTIIFSEMYGIFGSRMFQFPSKVMFLLPLFLLMISWSWMQLKSRVVQIVMAVFILAGNVYGLNNYYTGHQYLNPKFLVTCGDERG